MSLLGLAPADEVTTGAWLPSLMPCGAGLATEALTLCPAAAKNAFQEQSKQVFYASDPERFLGSWLEGLGEAFTPPQTSGRKDLQSISAS